MLAAASVGGGPLAVDVLLIKTFPFRSLQLPAMFQYYLVDVLAVDIDEFFLCKKSDV